MVAYLYFFAPHSASPGVFCPNQLSIFFSLAILCFAAQQKNAESRKTLFLTKCLTQYFTDISVGGFAMFEVLVLAMLWVAGITC